MIKLARLLLALCALGALTAVAVGCGGVPGNAVASVDGEPIESGDLDAFLSGKSPGDVVDVTVRRGSEEIATRVTLGGDGNPEWNVEPVPTPTERQLRLREGWLAPRAGSADR